MTEPDKFRGDYSYFKWQDIRVEVRREWVKVRNVAARTWLREKTTLLGDVIPSGDRFTGTERRATAKEFFEFVDELES